MRELFAYKQFYLKKIFTYFFFTFIQVVCFAQKQKDTLITVKVISTFYSSVSMPTPTPTQSLGKSDLANSISVADALKQFAGVYVKDYGGVGGLKTVSVRSLGANHTGVLYDGLILGDAQGGQTDLGRFTVDNIEQLQSYNSNANALLLPARAYASAALINIKTNGSIISAKEKHSLQIKLQQGSFSYFAPSISYKTVLTKKIQTSLHAWAQFSKSNYPFTSYENNSVTEKRINSDIKAQKLEYDLLYNKNYKNSIKLKAYWYNSDRGLPGAIVFYNTVSNQRLKDNNLFIQSTWNHKFSHKCSLLFSTKYSAEKNLYLDPSYPNSIGKLENAFHQQEIYASTAFSANFSNALSMSISSDYFNSTLLRKDDFAINFAAPDRNTFLQNVAFNFKKGAFNVQGNVLHTSIKEKVKFGNAASNLNQFSPAISASVKPFEEKYFYISAFYKNIFRAPTFNDLYYTNIGNTKLLPEYAEQFNIGLSFYKRNSGFINNVELTVNGYINNIKDKILAVPRQNLFQWSMQNIAATKIKGIDFTANADILNYKKYKFSARFSYTYQQALDVSDNTSSQYKTQLPYTPKHSANLMLSAQYKKLIFINNVYFSDNRYRQGDAIPENIVRGYTSNDVSIAYLHNSNYKIMAEANNIFNTQYEVIRFYPMPRFNYRLTFQISLKKLKKV
jgi:vitamin B12 transporter